MNDADRRETIEGLRRTPDRVRALIAGLDPATIVRRPSSDGFSIRENVHHLRDIEVEGYSVRLGRMLEEDDPSLPDLDGEQLARERRYNDTPHERALEELVTARRECVDRLGRLREEEWDRRGRLEGVGTVTVERLVALWLEHDGVHLEELERLAAAGRGR